MDGWIGEAVEASGEEEEEEEEEAAALQRLIYRHLGKGNRNHLQTGSLQELHRL